MHASGDPLLVQGFSRWALGRAVRHRGDVLGLSHVARHVVLAVCVHTHELDGLVRVSVAQLREDTGIPRTTLWRALRELAPVLRVERAAVVGWVEDHELTRAARAFARGARASASKRAPGGPAARDMSQPRAVLSPDEAAAFGAVRGSLSRRKAQRAGGVAIIETCAPDVAARIGRHVLAQARELGLEVEAYADRLVECYLREDREIVTRARHPLALLGQEIQLSTLAERAARRVARAAAPREPTREHAPERIASMAAGAAAALRRVAP